MKDDIQQAREAQRDTTKRFVEAVEAGEEVREIVSEFRGMRERNGFGKLLKAGMERR